MSKRDTEETLRALEEYRRCIAAVKDPVRLAEQREHTRKCERERGAHGLQVEWLRRAW